jgi:hypothetical protein
VKTRVLGPTLLAAGVLVGASMTPRLIKAWPAISKEIGRIARSAVTLDVFPIVLAVGLGFLLVTSVVLVLKGLWSRRRRSRTNRRVRRVAKLERSGYSLDTIARQSGLAQDAVRMLLAGSVRR